jgi:hypothetical protein
MMHESIFDVYAQLLRRLQEADRSMGKRIYSVFKSWQPKGRIHTNQVAWGEAPHVKGEDEDPTNYG